MFKQTVIITFCCLLLSNAKADEIQSILDDLQSVTRVPAFSFAAVKNGKTEASVVTGLVNTERNTRAKPEHLFRLASVSKVIGATLVADYLVRNKVSPNTPIGDWLTELPEAYRGLTLRQLMSNTSGMPHYQSIDPSRWTKQYDTALSALETLQNRSLLFEPGSAYQYSSHGFTLAGAAFEALTQKPLTESAPKFIKRLTNSRSPLIENITRRNPLRSHLFEKSGEGYTTIPFDNKSYTIFGSGFTATSEDLARFGDAVMNSSTITDETRELLFTPTKISGGNDAGTAQYSVGFGWRISKDAYDRTIYHHAGITPGARSALVLYPDEQLSVSFLSNAAWTSQIEKTAGSLAEVVLQKPEFYRLKRTQEITGSFDGKAFTASIHCKENDCFLTEHSDSLNAWLKGFSIDGKARDWPIYLTDKGLLMVTSVGLAWLKPDGENNYSTVFGSRRTLSFQFGPTDKLP